MNTRSEASIERAVVEYAKKKGMLVRKMNGLGYAGWPDRLFVPPKGQTFYIEFKRQGAKTKPVQDVVIDQLRDRWQHVYVVDTVARGKELVDEYS